MARVKAPRSYDSRGRLEQARRTRQTILDVARTEFEKRGYAATTVALIAQKAQVSVESVYKSFGGKPGLVRALHELGLAGQGAIPAPQRSDEMSASERDPRQILRSWGVLTSEVAPLVAPLLLLVRDAAATDPELVELLERSNAQRLERMRHNARLLAKRGFLRQGVSVAHAADLMWTLTAPELYELVVVRRGWTAAAFGELVASAMIAALL